MTPSANDSQEANTERFSLRLPPEIFILIDASRKMRAGNISRNTWIAEAIKERLVREQQFATGE